MTAREPRTIARLRKSPALSADITIVLAYADEMAARLERYANLDLTDEQIMQIAGPPTDAIGDKPVWMLGQRDLTRLARAILAAAAMKARGGGSG